MLLNSDREIINEMGNYTIFLMARHLSWELSIFRDSIGFFFKEILSAFFLFLCFQNLWAYFGAITLFIDINVQNTKIDFVDCSNMIETVFYVLQ